MTTRIFGATNLEKLDPVLLSPFLRRFLPLQQRQKYFSVSLKEFSNANCPNDGLQRRTN